MLSELRIRDFAIIEDLTLELGPGFTVFTGETGAGKSIIVDAVEVLVGGRADTTMIRSGAAAALIEGTFRIEPSIQSEVTALLEREGLLDEQHFVQLGREIRAQGKNVSRVNGRTVSLAIQRKLGEWLVDLHGQSEHLSLLRVREHGQLLDRFANVEDLLSSYGQTYRALGVLRSELATLHRSQADADRRAELLRYQIGEIQAARLQAGEIEGLDEERTRLVNAERLAHLAEQALNVLDHVGEEQLVATDLLGRATHALGKLASVDPSMQGSHQEAQAALESVSQLGRELRLYLEALEFDPQRLDEVEDRLRLIDDLLRKYGQDIDSVLAYAQEAETELEGISSMHGRMSKLSLEEGRRLVELSASAAELSESRRAAAQRLSVAIEAALRELRMEGAQFDVDLRWEAEESGVELDGHKVAFGASGVDQIEFLVEPNPGEGLKPLAKIASGGETSRLMLGLKSVLAQADRTPTLIFDEIDQGIGGRVGAVVGRMLWQLARQHQVLCITHLPQLAAYGDQHIQVQKDLQAGRTQTSAAPLTDEERQRELAVMLGEASSTNLRSAADLLTKVAQGKTAAEAGH